MRVTKLYCPPALGIIAANSPKLNAAINVIIPVRTQANKTRGPLPSCLVISEVTRNIPLPIMLPETSSVESNNPNFLVALILLKTEYYKKGLGLPSLFRNMDKT
jgi:hypothetical protein